MTAEWVTAIATVGTFIVIAASAFAALRQIRHMRSNNAISLLTSYNNEFDTQEFQLAFTWVRTELPKRLDDNEAIEALSNAPPYVGEYAAIRLIANFFEDMGAFVLTRLLDKHIVLTLYAENVRAAWVAIAPVAALTREKTKTPQIWENFEYLAAITNDFIDKHPNGTYPHSVPRMPVDERLLKRWRQRSGVTYDRAL